MLDESGMGKLNRKLALQVLIFTGIGHNTINTPKILFLGVHSFISLKVTSGLNNIVVVNLLSQEIFIFSLFQLHLSNTFVMSPWLGGLGDHPLCI